MTNDGYSPPLQTFMECKISIRNRNHQYSSGDNCSGSGWLTSNRVNGKTGSPKTGMIKLYASGWWRIRF